MFGAQAAPGPRRLNGDALLLDCALPIPLASPVMPRNDSFAEATQGKRGGEQGEVCTPCPNCMALE